MVSTAYCKAGVIIVMGIKWVERECEYPFPIQHLFPMRLCALLLETQLRRFAF